MIFSLNPYPHTLAITPLILACIFSRSRLAPLTTAISASNSATICACSASEGSEI